MKSRNSPLSWFYIVAKQSKLAEQWKDVHWVGQLKRANEHLLVIRSLTRSVGLEQVEDKRVMKSGIWAVSKQC